ncbi:TPA: hypothetical protein DIS56_02945 [Candidatus Saccharibacteria bacterium]|nr:MAG: hypothetical protein A3F05_04165 [Candidatus Saccharibacteria bacterium RIFCSPHIGHO2_12_FULL_47_17]HCM52063.1 hypothetical protein [Candidatus Saccharibacteria bacterium]
MDEDTQIQVNQTNSQDSEDADDVETNRIIQVRQKALQALLQNIDQIDSEPSRRFEILMMALRTTFSEDLLEKALDAALQIEEPNSRAEALLDVLNESKAAEQV